MRNSTQIWVWSRRRRGFTVMRRREACVSEALIRRGDDLMNTVGRAVDEAHRRLLRRSERSKKSSSLWEMEEMRRRKDLSDNLIEKEAWKLDDHRGTSSPTPLHPKRRRNWGDDIAQRLQPFVQARILRRDELRQGHSGSKLVRWRGVRGWAERDTPSLRSSDTNGSFFVRERVSQACKQLSGNSVDM